MKIKPNHLFKLKSKYLHLIDFLFEIYL